MEGKRVEIEGGNKVYGREVEWMGGMGEGRGDKGG